MRDSTSSEYRLYFLCSRGDDAEIVACHEAGGIVFVTDFPEQGNFARKINYGYRMTDGEFLLVGADDLRFERGWDEAALKIAEETGAGVIGTNDLHNPRVLQKRHSTHPLVRRSYIDEFGGTFDGTGEIFCELYDHQWVDNELCQTALLRGQWAFAEESVIEHLHPLWGLAESDPTYEKALRATRDDYRLFNHRMGRCRRMLRRRR
jgi:hypothetical protein